MKINPSLFTSVRIIVLALALGLGTSYLSAFTNTWTAPPAGTVAPANNMEAPINAGAVSQYKAGALSLGSAALPAAGAMLDVNGAISATNLLLTGTVTIAGGSPTAGAVLTAVNGTGLAAWQAAAPSCSTPTQQWLAHTYPGYADTYIYLTPLPAPSYTYATKTFLVYDPIKIYTGGLSAFNANPASAIAGAPTIPIAAARGSRFIFNTAQLASEASATQTATINGLSSFVANRYLCTTNTVNASSCHTNNIGDWTPAVGYVAGGSIYESYTDGTSGVSYSQGQIIGTYTTGGCAAAGVSKIVAGSGVTVSPAGGTGDVTVNAIIAPGAWCGRGYKFRDGAVEGPSCVGVNPFNSCPSGFSRFDVGSIPASAAALGGQYYGTAAQVFTCIKD